MNKLTYDQFLKHLEVGGCKGGRRKMGDDDESQQCLTLLMSRSAFSHFVCYVFSWSYILVLIEILIYELKVIEVQI